MDLAVKQRILGGVVLVAGAVLFLPLLLEGAGVRALQPPAAPAAPKVPDTAALAPAITHEAAALEADISASHGEPTFYPVQPPTVTVPEPEPAVEQQFHMVTPSAGSAPAATPAPAKPPVEAAPVAAAKPVAVAPAAVAAAQSATTAKADAAAAAAAAKAKADAEAKARAEAAARSKADADAKAAQDRMTADAAARARAEATAKAEAAARAKAKADAEARAKAEAAAKAKAAASKPAVVDSDPAAAQAWVVQVASLSSRAKADELVAKLRAKGYRAGIGGQEGAWRVSIGPELDRAVAESVKARVAADPALKLSGWIQAYRP